MATSNRDRVGKMFDVLSPALDAFIQRVLEPELTEGADWTMVVTLKDQQKGITGKTYRRTDPLLQLRMLSEGITGQVKQGWYPFRAHLSRAQESFASELREVRNSWAHGDSFSGDDTYRALDTSERLLRAVGAVAPADEVGALRVDLRRVSADQDDRKATRIATAGVESAGLPAWRDVLRPHEDVATGNFKAAEFAADLYKVSTGARDLGRDYSDPAEFFARTYLTTGLRDLIGWAVGRIAGDANAAPVINLQTNFGGGKTHSMLALWHLASGRPLADYPQAVQELLTANGYPTDGSLHVRRVALVGNHVAPTGSTKNDGTKVNTLWGELAWQLGGAEAYAVVADSDQKSTHPGEALHLLLKSYAPAVILIDEWVAYARVLYGREDLAGGTFDTQFTFAQSLTEAVKATPGVLVAISIPASDNADGTEDSASAEEVGGENGREALRRLQNIVRRVADQWRPASADESYEIVRRRLFAEPDAAALSSISRTAKEFVGFYRTHSTDFPREVRDSDYEDRIRRSYPIHPELFERLYEDWSTLDRFQRTRGVLRLMNHVIHALWIGDDRSPLIMPGSIPLSASEVNAELTQYLSDSWRAIIDADVDGPTSVPTMIDKEKPLFGQRSLTRRLARTVFFGAAPTIGSAHVGLETQRVFLGTAVPGDVPGNFHSALAHLADRGTYFYSSGSRHWYDTTANITRRAKDAAERLHQEDVWAEIVRRLGGQRSKSAGFAAVTVAPGDSADIPDVDEVRLVLVHPRFGHLRKAGSESPAVEFARGATEKRGSAHRTFRNMVVFLAGDSERLAELENGVREYLAWTQVVEAANDLNLTTQQISQAKERQARAEQTVSDRLFGAYHWVLVPEQKQADHPFEIAPVKADGSASSLAERVTRKLNHTGQLSESHTARLVRMDLEGVLAGRWAEGHIGVGELWTYYATYPYLRRLRDRDMLTSAVRSAAEVLLWQSDGFAVAESYDPVSNRYAGLVLPNDRDPIGPVGDTMLLVRPDRAEAQRRELIPDPDPDPDGDADPGDDASPPRPRDERSRRFFGTRELRADRYASDFKKIVDEVLQHLASVADVQLTVRIDIDAFVANGFDEDKIRTVSENATTLKFEQHSFEES